MCSQMQLASGETASVGAGHIYILKRLDKHLFGDRKFNKMNILHYNFDHKLNSKWKIFKIHSIFFFNFSAVGSNPFHRSCLSTLSLQQYLCRGNSLEWQTRSSITAVHTQQRPNYVSFYNQTIANEINKIFAKIKFN